MTVNLPGNEHRSLWIDTTPSTDYPALLGDAEFDVAVIGGGITGLTTAMILQHSGASVVVLEARRIALGTTGNTTAKVTALHGLTYEKLLADHGEDAAHAYAQANLVALEFIATLVAERAMDCDFARMAAFTYTESPKNASRIEAEVMAANRLGMPAHYVTETSLPFPIHAAVRLDHQALFHPRKYCLALAKLIETGGGAIFESTRATDITETDGRVEVRVEGDHVVRAQHAVVATLLPFHDPRGLFAKTRASRSYAVSAPAAKPLDGMYLGIDEPTRSARSHMSPDGAVLVLGGDEHKTGQEPDTAARFAAVERWARERFGVQTIAHRWSAQDYSPAGGIPYIGPVSASGRVLVASAFKKWGMTNGTAAAMMLSDRILGRPNAWLPFFDPARLSPRASAASLVKENVNVAQHFIGDRLPKRTPSLDELAPGEGAVIDHGGEKVAAFRDPERGLCTFSSRCTHMGCIVSFNAAERTFDCPCHGSRFGTDGQVIEGPATAPLAAKEVTNSR